MRRLLLIGAVVLAALVAVTCLAETCNCCIYDTMNLNGNGVTNVRANVVSITDTNDYTVLVSDSGRTFVYDMAYATTNTKEFLLPSVDASHMGLEYRFVNVVSNFCLVTPADSDTINGSDAVAGYSSKVGVNYTSLEIVLATDDQWVVTDNEGEWGPY